MTENDLDNRRSNIIEHFRNNENINRFDEIRIVRAIYNDKKT